ncbi:MAG: redoxin domain-containing protein, partial [bacterium]
MTAENDVRFPGVGAEFPKLKVNTTRGPLKIPGDIEEDWFLFFSHPADFTPVCTSEFVSFARSYDKFQELG